MADKSENTEATDLSNQTENLEDQNVEVSTDLALAHPLSEVFSYNNLVHAIAGASGSVVAMSTFYPLDLARTKLQADDSRKAVSPLQALKDLVKEEGLPGLYRGLTPVLTSLYCSNFVYFYAFNGFKAVAKANLIPSSSSLDLIFGYVSGCINALVTTPLWVVNTRMKLQSNKRKVKIDALSNDVPVKYNGLLDGLHKIAKEEGLSSLWNGVEASFILSGNPAIHFMVYNALKRFLTRIKSMQADNPSISSFEFFLIGGFAKAVATVITYPLQLAQCKLRANKREGNSQETFVDVIKKVIRQSGVLGLYKGMESKLYQTVLTAALMFLIYEKLVAYIHGLFGVKKVAKKQ